MQHIDEQYILDNFESAMKNGYIRAYYQPVIRTLTEEICSVEALARWHDPSMGLLSPFLFISVLEKYRLIHKLDLSILENICITYNEMREKGLPLHPFSINLSRLDFNEVDMLGAISDIINKYKVPSTAIHIEITESVIGSDFEFMKEQVERFRELGFPVWMDDFGSGYSSLNVLKDYSFDVLKVDMRFLSDIGLRSKKILSSVINMAKAIGIHTLAEGVETKEQMKFLRSIGCEMLQGFYYSKPMDSAMYIDYLTNSGISVEKMSEHKYWDTIGQLNFLSPDPLRDSAYSAATDMDATLFQESSSALALIEIIDGKVRIHYANKAYRDAIKKVGYKSINSLENAIQKLPDVYYIEMLEQINATLKTDKIIKKDHFANNIYFSYSTKCIAKTDKKCMIAANIYTYDPVHDLNRNDLFEKYSRVLLNTYEHVTVIDFNTNSVIIRLFSRIGFGLEYTLMPLNEAFKKFAKNEILDREQERFLKYVDHKGLRNHMEQTGNTALQQPFHVRDQDGIYRLRDIRLIRITVEDGEKFLFVIQSMSPSAVSFTESIMRKNQDQFTEW